MSLKSKTYNKFYVKSLKNKLYFRFYCKFNYYNEYYKSYADGAINNKTSELMYFLKKMERDEFWKESRDPYANASECKLHLYT